MSRRNRKRFSFNPKYIYFFLVVLCLAAAFFSYRFRDKLSPVKTAVGNVLTPMQKGIGTAGSVIANRLQILSDKKSLIEKNEKLEAELQKYKDENSMLTLEKYELDWYRELYELDQMYYDYPKVAAKVISRESNSYYNIFTIDKGADDGIEVDMNVMAGNGLVGLVTEVGKNWAKVRAIIDDNSSVSGMFLTTSDTCIVRGDIELIDRGYIRVGMINMDAEIYENYEVVTSNISDKYLPGILIGYISNIKLDSSNMSKEAYLTPVVDFEHLNAVLIITEKKETLKNLDEE